MNRRNFIKTTGAAIAASSLLPITVFGSNTTPTVSNHAIDWINNNIRIRDPKAGSVLIKLNPIQERYINQLEDPTSKFMQFATNERQVGYTTATAAYIVYKVVHEDKCNIATISANLQSRNHIRNMISHMYMTIPESCEVKRPVKLIRISSDCIRFERTDGTIEDSVHCMNVHEDRDYGCGSAYKYVFLQDYEYYDESQLDWGNYLINHSYWWPIMGNNVIAYSHKKV